MVLFGSFFQVIELFAIIVAFVGFSMTSIAFLSNNAKKYHKEIVFLKTSIKAYSVGAIIILVFGLLDAFDSLYTTFYPIGEFAFLMVIIGAGFIWYGILHMVFTANSFAKK